LAIDKQGVRLLRGRGSNIHHLAGETRYKLNKGSNLELVAGVRGFKLNPELSLYLRDHYASHEEGESKAA